MERIKPCPFCGGKVEVVVCDDEGNRHTEEYEKDPWSGLGYMLSHSEDNAIGDCPIAQYAGESVGILIYDSREEAIEAWNNRAGVVDDDNAEVE